LIFIEVLLRPVKGICNSIMINPKFRLFKEKVKNLEIFFNLDRYIEIGDGGA